MYNKWTEDFVFKFMSSFAFIQADQSEIAQEFIAGDRLT